MDISLKCIYCIIKKTHSLISKYEIDESSKLESMKQVFKLISISPKGDTSPYLNARINRFLKDKFKLNDNYYEIKKEYNKLLIFMEKEIGRYIYNSQDRLLSALKYAMAGNFIDFGAMNKVDIDKLKKLLKISMKQIINIKEYENFKEGLENSKRIVYIADNAGEIVLDKMFIKVIKETYSNVVVDVIVRGKSVYNDATMEDAREIGLCGIVNVFHNGTDIPGTQLNKVNVETKRKIYNADLIIAKGQGNFETLFGCGKNIYYIFLCKCDLFAHMFNVEKLKGIFANERNIKFINGDVVNARI